MVDAPDDAQSPQAALKAETKALMAQRDALEQQLSVASARLDASGAGLHGSLVDREVLLANCVIMEPLCLRG